MSGWFYICPMCASEGAAQTDPCHCTCGSLLTRESNESLDSLRADLARVEGERDAAQKRFTAPVVCMCGSTRFKQTWIAENARLTGEGNIVLAVGLWGHHERIFPDAETKARLDDLHKRKIDLCDFVYVLDVDGYIGESTQSEIIYAMSLGKPISYLSNKFPQYTKPVDPLVEERQAHAATREELDATRAALGRAVEIIQYALDHADKVADRCLKRGGGKVRSISTEPLYTHMLNIMEHTASFIGWVKHDPTAQAALAEQQAMRWVCEAADKVLTNALADENFCVNNETEQELIDALAALKGEQHA